MRLISLPVQARTDGTALDSQWTLFADIGVERCSPEHGMNVCDTRGLGDVMGWMVLEIQVKEEWLHGSHRQGPHLMKIEKLFLRSEETEGKEEEGGWCGESQRRHG